MSSGEHCAATTTASSVVGVLLNSKNWHVTAIHASVVFGIVLVVLIPVLLFLIRRNTRHPSSIRTTATTKKNKSSSSSSSSEPQQHVIITGGSSGIGLSLAKECCRHFLYKQQQQQQQQQEDKQNNVVARRSHVTLIARNKSKLEAAKSELLSLQQQQQRRCDGDDGRHGVIVHTVSADVSDYEGLVTALRPILNSTSTIPPPTILFNVAGLAIPVRFLEGEICTWSRLMNVNYLGTVHATRAVVPYMIDSRNGHGGTVVITSSAAGQVGIYGYSAYAPTKFALRGLAESLSMELAPHHVRVQLVFPPNTDTPGFEQENLGKMEECRLMEDDAGLFSPEVIAKKMLAEALRPNPPFMVYFGLEGWMLTELTSGMSTVHTFFDAFCQVTLMSLLRFVSLFYLKNWRDIVDRCHDQKVPPQQRLPQPPDQPLETKDP